MPHSNTYFIAENVDFVKISGDSAVSKQDLRD